MTPADAILADEARRANATVEELISPRRFAHLVRARQRAMWRIRQATGWSYPKIGRLFGRDHTTVMHAVDKINAEVRAGSQIGVGI